MDALILGFTSGTSCLASCAPFLVPILAVNGVAGRASKAATVAAFLAGRLAAYLAVGFLVGMTGGLAAGYLTPAIDRALLRVGWAVGGAILLAGGLAGIRGPAMCAALAKAERPRLSALGLGLAAGLNICPPFVAAMSRAAGLGAAGGAAYFTLFFVGTSVWLLPFALIPSLRRHAEELRRVARAAMVLLGAYFLVILGLLGWN